MQVNQMKKNLSEGQKASIGPLRGNKWLYSRTIRGRSRKMVGILRSVAEPWLS
jgi:hypothetical protein